MKNLGFIVLLAMMMSCGQGNSNRTVGSKNEREESKAVSEYRDSGKWGKAVSRDFECGEFDSFEATGHIEVVFRQTDDYAVKTVGHKEALSLYDLQIVEKDGKRELNVKLKESADERYDNIPTITLLIAAPVLKNVTVSGGDVELKGKLIQDEDLNIYVKGEGDVFAKDVEVGDLNVEISGRGDVTLKKAKAYGNATVTVNGDGDIEGKLKCKDARIEVNGSGTVDVNIKCKELTAKCNGRGDIELEGECTVLKKRDGANGAIDSRKLAAQDIILLEN